MQVGSYLTSFFTASKDNGTATARPIRANQPGRANLILNNMQATAGDLQQICQRFFSVKGKRYLSERRELLLVDNLIASLLANKPNCEEIDGQLIYAGHQLDLL